MKMTQALHLQNGMEAEKLHPLGMKWDQVQLVETQHKRRGRRGRGDLG